MTKYEITFFINDIAKIIIPLKDPVEFLGPIYIEKILLIFSKHKALISKTTIYHDMLHLSNLLKKALNQELFLDRYTKNNIGYLHNEYLYKSVNHLTNDNVDWKGYDYSLWSARNKLTSLDSWIYNSTDGSIVFEVTPVYPYLFSEPEEEPDYIPYEEWIKTYKPYFITILSRETALQWIEQADKIIGMVEFNEKRMQYRSKIDVES
jgi:hypothetical protein